MDFDIAIDMNRLFPLQLFKALFSENDALDNYDKYMRSKIDDIVKDGFGWLVDSLKECNIELDYNIIHLDSDSASSNSDIFLKGVCDTLGDDVADTLDINYFNNNERKIKLYQSETELPTFLHKLVEWETVRIVNLIIDHVKYTYWDLMEDGILERSKEWNRFSLFRNEVD